MRWLPVMSLEVTQTKVSNVSGLAELFACLVLKFLSLLEVVCTLYPSRM